MAHVPTDERRKQFTDAAAKIIREEGLAKATTRRIAQEANAPLGSLHYCFRNKEELFEAVSQKLLDEGLGRAGDTVLPGMGITKAASEILRTLSAWIMANKTSQIGEFEFYSWIMRSENHGDVPKRIYNKWIGTLRDILQSAATPAEQHKNFDMLARTILALTDGFNLQDSLLRESRITENMEVVISALVSAIDELHAFELPVGDTE